MWQVTDRNGRDFGKVVRAEHLNLQEWTVWPDFASVNFEEPGVVDLCNALLERGIGVEAGLSSAAEVDMW